MDVWRPTAPRRTSERLPRTRRISDRGGGALPKGCPKHGLSTLALPANSSPISFRQLLAAGRWNGRLILGPVDFALSEEYLRHEEVLRSGARTRCLEESWAHQCGYLLGTFVGDSRDSVSECMNSCG